MVVQHGTGCESWFLKKNGNDQQTDHGQCLMLVDADDGQSWVVIQVGG